jgi:hypothetical protein
MGAVDRNYRGKHLQIHVTMEDGNVFTTPWSATLTYVLGTVPWPETGCAENRFVSTARRTARQHTSRISEAARRRGSSSPLGLCEVLIASSACPRSRPTVRP